VDEFPDTIPEKLRLRCPSRKSSIFSPSILSLKLSKELNASGGVFGGLHHVPVQ